MDQGTNGRIVMAEEWGTVIVKASNDVLGQLRDSGDDYESAKLLAVSGGVPEEKISDLILRTEKVVLQHGYAVIDYDCADWRAFSELFVNDANGLELYSRTNDEYGTAAFHCLNADGDRFHFWFDQGGDLCDIEGYEDEVMAKIDKWVSMLPDDLKAGFPGFIETDDLMFDGP